MAARLNAHFEREAHSSAEMATINAAPKSVSSVFALVMLRCDIGLPGAGFFQA